MTTRQSGDRFLRGALEVNKWIAGVAGVVVMLAAGPLAVTTGLAAKIGFDPGLAVVFTVGIGLLIFSGALGGLSRVQLRRRTAMAAFRTNVAFVGGGVLLLAAPLSLTTLGLALAALLAASSAVISAVEAYGIWCTPAFKRAASH
jgi:hypothetical protein